MNTINPQPRPNKTDAGNGSKAICRVSNVLRSPSPDPKRSAENLPMKPYCIALVILPFLSNLLPAVELVPIAKQFVEAVAKLDNEKLAGIYADSPTKQNAIKALGEAAPMIESGKLKIGAIDKELIIGDLGVTLTRLESTDPPKVGYKPLIFVRVGGIWKVFPWAAQSDLKALADQRTPEERIHLQLFNKWANLMEELLDEQEAEQAVPPNGP